MAASPPSNHESGLAMDTHVSPTLVTEHEFDVLKEAEELGEILDEMEKIQTLPDPEPEQFYPVNRAARRKADKRNRALKKRKPNG